MCQRYPTGTRRNFDTFGLKKTNPLDFHTISALFYWLPASVPSTEDEQSCLEIRRYDLYSPAHATQEIYSYLAIVKTHYALDWNKNNSILEPMSPMHRTGLHSGLARSAGTPRSRLLKIVCADLAIRRAVMVQLALLTMIRYRPF